MRESLAALALLPQGGKAVGVADWSPRESHVAQMLGRSTHWKHIGTLLPQRSFRHGDTIGIIGRDSNPVDNGKPADALNRHPNAALYGAIIASLGK